jgi:hypothetical protein
MICTRGTGKCVFALSFFVLFVATPVLLLASGNWKQVAVTEQKDVWYVEQIIGFSSKGAVLAARARLKFVAGKESAIGRDVKKGLMNDGVNADTFHYFVESVEVDCKKKFFTVSSIDFFDAEDSRIFGQIFTEPKRYSTTSGSAFEIISWDLCQNRPPLVVILKDTLKSKKPFLYFYPQRETAK